MPGAPAPNKPGEVHVPWNCRAQCAFCVTLGSSSIVAATGVMLAVFMTLLLTRAVSMHVAWLVLIEGSEAVQAVLLACGAFLVLVGTLGIVAACCSRCHRVRLAPPPRAAVCLSTAVFVVYVALLVVACAVTLAAAVALAFYSGRIVPSGGAAAADCPYPANARQRFVAGNSTMDNAPSVLTCPIDFFVYSAFYATEGASSPSTLQQAFVDTWNATQVSSLTCGYYCDTGGGYTCTPSLGAAYARQTTGEYCTRPVDVPRVRSTVYEGGNTYALGAPSQMAFRPTLLALVDTYVVYAHTATWGVATLCVVLTVAAVVLCRRRRPVVREAVYKAGMDYRPFE